MWYHKSTHVIPTRCHVMPMWYPHEMQQRSIIHLLIQTQVEYTLHLHTVFDPILMSQSLLRSPLTSETSIQSAEESCRTTVENPGISPLVLCLDQQLNYVHISTNTQKTYILIKHGLLIRSLDPRPSLRYRPIDIERRFRSPAILFFHHGGKSAMFGKSQKIDKAWIVPCLSRAQSYSVSSAQDKWENWNASSNKTNAHATIRSFFQTGHGNSRFPPNVSQWYKKHTKMATFTR